MIAGNANGSDGIGASGGTIQIDYGSGTGSTELDTSGFTNPAGKNADDLVQYAIHAYEEHWGYVWGTFGHVLTESLFEAKLAQYPDALAGNADFIRQTWVGGRTTDCVGLIKGYGWLDAETEEIVYNTNGMPDITANEMFMPQASPARLTPFRKRRGLPSGTTGISACISETARWSRRWAHDTVLSKPSSKERAGHTG